MPGVTFAVGFHLLAPAVGAWFAFTDWNGVGSARWIGLSNFREIFHAAETRDALWHTLELSAAFLIASNVIGLSLALALNRTLKTRYFLRAIFFLPAVVIPLATSYIWQYVFNYNGAFNKFLAFVGLASWERPWLGDPSTALWAVLVVLTWQFAGLSMVIYLAGLQGIPEELEEAAEVDGASAWLRFRCIVVPLLAPAITVSATLTLIFGLRVFDQILALTGGGPVGATETLATEVYQQTFSFGRFGYGAALALILSALIMVLAITQLTVLRAREKRL